MKGLLNRKVDNQAKTGRTRNLEKNRTGCRNGLRGKESQDEVLITFHRKWAEEGNAHPAKKVRCAAPRLNLDLLKNSDTEKSRTPTREVGVGEAGVPARGGAARLQKSLAGRGTKGGGGGGVKENLSKKKENNKGRGKVKEGREASEKILFKPSQRKNWGKKTATSRGAKNIPTFKREQSEKKIPNHFLCDLIGCSNLRAKKNHRQR